jgi:hypothetical protein
MVSIVKTWLINENYWTLHPMVQEFGAFKKLYLRDKSKDKKESSKLMWGIAMFVDPHEDNKLRTQPFTRRKEIINEDWFDPKFNWEHPEIIQLIEEYTDYCLTISEKELIRYEKKLSQRGDFIDKTDYSLDQYSEINGRVEKGTADQLDKMMLNSGKIFDEVEKIKEKIQKEDLNGHLKGGAVESAADKGEI